LTFNYYFIISIFRIEEFDCIATAGSESDGILETILIPWDSDTMPSNVNSLILLCSFYSSIVSN